MEGVLSITALIIQTISSAETASRIARSLYLSQTESGEGRLSVLNELGNEFESLTAILKNLQVVLGRRDWILRDDALATELAFASRTLYDAEDLLKKYEKLLRPNPGEKGHSIVKHNRLKLFISLSGREASGRVIQRLRSHTMNLGLLFNFAAMRDIPRENGSGQSEIVIAVMGEPGAGKSRFIHQIVGPIDEDQTMSKTKKVLAHSITIDNRLVTLVDIPGFDDSAESDDEILEEVATWLSMTYRSGQRLSGIVFLQPITMEKITWSSVKTIDIFEQMVGIDKFFNIMLTTSKWDLLGDQVIGTNREEALQNDFWAPLIESGCLTARFSGDRDSALSIVKRLAFDQRSATKVALAIQREMVDEGTELDATAASWALYDWKYEDFPEAVVPPDNSSGIRRRNVPAGYEEQLYQMQEERDRAHSEQVRLQAELNRASEREEMTNRMREDWEARLKTLQNLFAQIDTQTSDFESPPPYTEKSSEMSPSDTNLQTSVRLQEGWMTLSNAYKLSRYYLSKAIRPNVSEGFSRIEWTCSCGDPLYGDFQEMSPGSLQIFAARLGGTITASPPGQMTSPQSLQPIPAAPPHVLLRPDPNSGGMQNHPATPWSSSSSKVPAASSSQSAVNAKQNSQMQVAGKKFLELCIRTGKYTHAVCEIDVSGDQSDSDIFTKIRANYNDSRTHIRLGGLSLREPIAGHFVKFRMDKSPSVAIMDKPSVPPTSEVAAGHYQYDPVPMDEPPMPTQLFMHYFCKVTAAHKEALWFTRFPQKLDESLVYSAKHLAVGWGIEIVEGPNLFLFSLGMGLALLLSGLVAGLYAVFAKDTPTGVAIGAWLTAIQTLAAAAMFFKWA